MILTETLFRKIISFAALQETQLHAEVMAQASAVLKGAHKRGVELEYILEVRAGGRALPCSRTPAAKQPRKAGQLFLPFASCNLRTPRRSSITCSPL